MSEIKTKEEIKNNWPDEVRLEMIDRSEFYNNPTVYQFGYYDGYQKALAQLSAPNTGKENEMEARVKYAEKVAYETSKKNADLMAEIQKLSANTGKADEKLIYSLSSKGFEDMLEDFTIDHLKDSGYSVGSEEASDITYAEKNRRIVAATDIILNGLPSSANTGKGGVWEALQELVYLKSIKDIEEYKDEYERRKPLAWAAAKKAVASPETSLLNTGKADEWIRVDEKLPGVMQEVLFTHTDVRDWGGNKVKPSISFGWYDRDKFHSYIDPRDNWAATHWRPLPAPPVSTVK